jgi:allophanate hydrolase
MRGAGLNDVVQNPIPLTVKAWLQAYRHGANPGGLLRACLRRARESSPAGTWIRLATDAEFAREVAALDAIAGSIPDRAELIARYPLFGVPYAVKDNIDVAQVPTTAACPAFERVAQASAGVVQKLQAAGAVWIGKTNLDQFATGLVGTRSPYGQPACVFHPDYVSGGSSSGSAVAVAAGLVPFALGTDTAGSGRVPAALNQLVGLKPTRGRIGSSGVLPACRTLDCVSLLALTVDDASHVLSVVEGEDPEDCYSRFTPGPAAWGAASLRIGVPRDPQLAAASGYHKAYAASLSHARALGHSVLPIDFSLLHQTASLLYSGPWVAERHTVVEELMRTRPDALDPTVREIIGAALRYSATDAFRAQYALKELQRKAAAIWDEVDLLLVPSVPGHPRFADVAADPVGANNRLGTYTNFVNLLGWCALALPAGRSESDLPFGVTFIAPANFDAALARFGCAWQYSLDLPLGATGVSQAAGAAAAVELRTPAAQPVLPLAVVGAHMSGLPLNAQLRERGASLSQRTTSAARYRLYALPGTTPPKPGLVRVPDAAGEGCAIELEVWNVPLEQLGSLLALIPAPLGLGSIELADGSWVHGFLCEARGVAQAQDISRFGGWRNYLKSQPSSASSAGPAG